MEINQADPWESHDFENDILEEEEEEVPQNFMQPEPYERVWIEDCLALTIGDLCRNLLHKGKNGKPKHGLAHLQNRNWEMPVGFRLIPENPPKLLIVYPGKEYPQLRTQKITILTQPAGPRVKPFFFCTGCGTLRSKLFLRPDANTTASYFACPKCLNLAHELEFIKRRAGIVQQMNYRTNRIIKCEKLRKSMKHRVYNGKMTSVEWRWI
jgi:hypothetical protein